MPMRLNRLVFCVWLTLLLLILAGPLWVTHWFSSRTELFELAKETSWSTRSDWNAVRDPKRLTFAPETRLSRSQLRLIGGFEGLDRLSIGGLNDSDLELLQGLRGLQSLILTEASISDQGLKYISKYLCLWELRITEATNRKALGGSITLTGMSHLGTLTGLRILNINSQQLTDDNIAPLANCISLEALDLASSNIHGIGLKHLRSLTQLRDLRLDGCTISDDSGFRSLQHNAALRLIWLRNCGQPDEPILALANVPQLERLYLNGSKVTDFAITRLHSVHPELWISDPSGRPWSPGKTEAQTSP